MEKIKTVLKIVGIIIAIVIIGVLILKISVTKKYDGKEINYCPLIKDNLYDFLLAHINEKEKLKSKTL